MPTVTHLMREYFDAEAEVSPSKSGTQRLFESFSLEALPVVPDKTTWRVVTDPERFIRRFEFDTRERLKDFVSDVMSMEDSLGHHGKMIIDGTSVDIDVYTHTVDCITELDQEYISIVDKIYEDVLHYGYNNAL